MENIVIIERAIEHVTKKYYYNGVLEETYELTPREYMDQWCDMLYERAVLGRKGFKLTHELTHNVGQGDRVLTRYQNGKVRWDYEIHWKK